MSNVVVTQTINKVSWKVDQGSYANALKRIKAMKTAWTDSTKAALKAEKQYAAAAKRFRQSQQPIETPAQRKQRSQRVKQLREEAALLRRTNQIRAAGVRFNTKNTAYNLTAAQRTQAISDFASLSKQYHAGSMALGEYNARLAQLHTRMRNVGGLAKKPINVPVKAQIVGLDSSLMSGMGGIMGGMAAFGLGRQVMDTGQQFEAAKNGLTAVMGGAEQAGKEFAYLRSESNRLGLDLIQTTRDYTRFAASANEKLDTSQIHNLFEGISEYGRVTGATAEEQSRSLTAISQILSKGQLMAEEVKGQLAESSVGSTQLLVKALQRLKNNVNLTEKDLYQFMKDGDLMARDIMPLFADELKKAARAGGALDAAVKSNAAAMQRMKTASQNAMNSMFQSGFGEELTRSFDNLTMAINGSEGAFKLIGNIAGESLGRFNRSFTTLHDTFITISAITEMYAPSLYTALALMGDKSAQAEGKFSLLTEMLWKLCDAIKYLISFTNPLDRIMTVLSDLGVVDVSAKVDDKRQAAQQARDGSYGPQLPTPQTKNGVVMPAPKLDANGQPLPAETLGDRYPMLGKLGSMANNIFGGFAGTSQAVSETRDYQKQIMGSGLPEYLAKPADKPFWNMYNQKPTVDMQTAALSPARMPAWANQPLKGEAEIKLSPIEIKLDEGNLKGLITAAVEDNNTMQYNLLLGVPE